MEIVLGDIYMLCSPHKKLCRGLMHMKNDIEIIEEVRWKNAFTPWTRFSSRNVYIFRASRIYHHKKNVFQKQKTPFAFKKSGDFIMENWSLLQLILEKETMQREIIFNTIGTYLTNVYNSETILNIFILQAIKIYHYNEFSWSLIKWI